MQELTPDQKSDLVDAFDADLAEMVSKRMEKPSLGFVSLCKKLDIPTQAYRHTRATDREFAELCAGLEQDRLDILGELVFGHTMTAGKPKDQLALAERVDAEAFGKKAEERVLKVEAIFRQLPEEQLTKFAIDSEESVLRILETEDKYKSNSIKGLLSE